MIRARSLHFARLYKVVDKCKGLKRLLDRDPPVGEVEGLQHDDRRPVWQHQQLAQQALVAAAQRVVQAAIIQLARQLAAVLRLEAVVAVELHLCSAAGPGDTTSLHHISSSCQGCSADCIIPPNGMLAQGPSLGGGHYFTRLSTKHQHAADWAFSTCQNGCKTINLLTTTRSTSDGTCHLRQLFM